jgi:F-type H+-transporting ATPase subunit delta
LAAVLTDTAVVPAERRAIVSELLEGRVREPTRRLASFAVAEVKAPEVPAGLDWLAHRAGPAHRGEEPLLGHLSARERIGGYATAVFEEASTTELEEVEDQLFRFARIVAANPELMAELTDRDVPIEIRLAIVTELLSGKVEAATERLVRFVVVGGRPRDFVGALDWLVERTAAARGWRVARVRAAEELGEPQRDQLAQALSRLSGNPVELQVTLDRDLLGGVVVNIGDLQVDATARGRLDRLREELLPAGAESGRTDRGRGQP